MTHLRRDDWRVRPVEHWVAARFIEQQHYAGGAPNTAVAAHALMPAGAMRVRGVALWLPPTRAAAATVEPDEPHGVLALSRLCVAPDMPTNAASFLLGASMRLLDRATWPTLLTYADTRQGHTGAIYRATNWQCLGEVRGWDTWQHSVTGEMRGRKRGARNLSADEMRELGFERLPDMPKIKYVHRVRRRPRRVEPLTLWEVSA